MFQKRPHPLEVEPSSVIDIQLAFSEPNRRLGMQRMLETVPGQFIEGLPLCLRCGVPGRPRLSAPPDERVLLRLAGGVPASEHDDGGLAVRGLERRVGRRRYGQFLTVLGRPRNRCREGIHKWKHAVRYVLSTVCIDY